MSTLKEVALLSGYAVSTVSVVLGGKSAARGIPEETQRKIQEAAAELNYQPNIAARALRDHDNAGMFLVALFWSYDFYAPFMTRFFNGLRNNLTVNAAERNIKFVINFYDRDKLKDEPGLQSQSYYHAAIICNASAADMEYLENSTFPIPVVICNRPSRRHNSILVDEFSFGEIPLKVFSSHEKRSSQVIIFPQAYAGMKVRQTLFNETSARYHVNFLNSIICDNTIPAGYNAAQRIVEQGTIPETIFCASDSIATGVIRGLYENNISVPRDVEIIAAGNGDPDYENYSIPSLSVVAYPMEDMASRCLDRLLELLSSPHEPAKQEFIDLEYIPRESCGPIYG